MPLRDHFHRPARGIWPWQSVLVTWATKMVQCLNTHLLPPHCFAIPIIHLNRDSSVDIVPAAEGTPKAPLVIPTALPELDVLTVEVRDDEDGFRLLAVVELASPRNKDRPTHRRAFAAKCAAYLQQEVSVVVVNIITERGENLHAELMDLLGLGKEAKTALTSNLYAIAYRPVGREQGKPRLEMWPSLLDIGLALPVLPLWIAPDRAVPLDLEASYTAACESLRMP